MLTATELGYGKRSSSYGFRVSRRGGKGIKATDTSKLGEIGHLVAALPVEPIGRKRDCLNESFGASWQESSASRNGTPG